MNTKGDIITFVSPSATEQHMPGAPPPGFFLPRLDSLGGQPHGSGNVPVRPYKPCLKAYNSYILLTGSRNSLSVSELHGERGTNKYGNGDR